MIKCKIPNNHKLKTYIVLDVKAKSNMISYGKKLINLVGKGIMIKGEAWEVLQLL